jgi:hypothetical protein
MEFLKSSRLLLVAPLFSLIVYVLYYGLGLPTLTVLVISAAVSNVGV